MAVHFEMRTPPPTYAAAGGEPTPGVPTEYVVIAMPNSKDVLSRRATDEDRQDFRPQYEAFLHSLKAKAQELVQLTKPKK